MKRFIKSRDVLFPKAKNTKSDQDWADYRQAKNKVSREIRSTKSDYFKEKFKENKHNSRKLWNLIKCLSNADSEENHHIQRLVEGYETIVEKESIAELFNGYFVGLAKQLYTTAEMQKFYLLVILKEYLWKGCCIC